MNFVRLIRVEAERLLREIRYYKFDQMISFFDLLLICLGIFTGMGRDLFPGQSIFYAWIGMILWALRFGWTPDLLQHCGKRNPSWHIGTADAYPVFI